MDPATKVLDDKIEHHFKYHAPTPEQIPVYNEIREAGKAFAKVIAKNTAICADQTAALRHIEDAVMTANAAVARGGK
jgi:hypothetical protein